MLTIYLMAYACHTTARDDCSWEYVDHFNGPSAGIRCEFEREAWIDGKRGYPASRGSRLVTFHCETGDAPLVRTESDER